MFLQSIEALQRLNALGYGQAGRGLELDLVYNPGGPSLPPAQAALEADYRRRLIDDFGIVFDRLFTMANMPIKRFAHALERDGQHERYMQLLIDHFNPRAAEGVMCRNLVSVGWDGALYDCDFNQMLALPAAGRRRTLWEIERLDAIDTDRSSSATTATAALRARAAVAAARWRDRCLRCDKHACVTSAS